MKNYFLIACSFITLHTHAMKTEMEKKFILQPSDPCWFIGLPVEVIDYIAELLSIETEKEFIERTKALKIQKTPGKYLNNLPVNPSKVALSHDGNILAYIYREPDDSSTCCDVMRYKTMISIKHILSNNIEHHEIRRSFSISYPHGFYHPTIAFNKQGTKIIIHGTDYWQLEHLNLSAHQIAENPIRHHIIIPLTVNTTDPNAETKKTFAKYCTEQRICKDFNKQLALTQ